MGKGYKLKLEDGAEATVMPDLHLKPGSLAAFHQPPRTFTPLNDSQREELYDRLRERQALRMRNTLKSHPDFLRSIGSAKRLVDMV